MRFSRAKRVLLAKRASSSVVEQQWMANAEAMKLLADSLASKQFLVPPNVPRSPPIRRIDYPSNWINFFDQLGQQQIQKAHDEEEWITMSTVSSQNVDDTPTLSETSISPPPRSMDRELESLIKTDVRKAIKLFRKQPDTFHPSTVKKLFHATCQEQRPAPAIKLYDYLVGQYPSDAVTMTKHLCYSFSRAQAAIVGTEKAVEMARKITHLVSLLDRQGQEECLPILLYSLAKRSLFDELTISVYEYMRQQDMEYTSQLLHHLLTQSSFHRRDFLPFADIMKELHERGDLNLAVPEILEHSYPFTSNIDSTKRMLHLLLETKDAIDMGTLEAIAAGAASRGDIEMNLLLWQVLNTCNKSPSLAILEHTAVTMASDRSMYGNMFDMIVLIAEKSNGKASRAFIRSLSTLIRVDPELIGSAREILDTRVMKGEPVDLSCWNLLLSAWAERGEPSECIALFSELDDMGFHPDTDSFSYAFESFGKSIIRRFKNRPQLINRCLKEADFLILQMEESGVEVDHYLIRQYVELLLLSEQRETAVSVVREMQKRGVTVDNKTIYRLATSCIEANDIETAHSLAYSGTESLPFLQSMIDRAVFGKKEEAINDEETVPEDDRM